MGYPCRTIKADRVAPLTNNEPGAVQWPAKSPDTKLQSSESVINLKFT